MGAEEEAAVAAAAADGSSPTRDKARSTSSWVKFLDWRNATLFSIGEEATEGSWRTVMGQR